MTEEQTVRCRCTGCQGPPACRCCNEPVLEYPDDIEDGPGVEPVAERALVSSAEAYRLVAEAREMRAGRDAWIDAAGDLTERLSASETDLAASRAREAELREAVWSATWKHTLEPTLYCIARGDEPNDAWCPKARRLYEVWVRTDAARTASAGGET